MSFWESIRVVGLANVLSSLAGLPIANLLSAGLQYSLESAYFRDLNRPYRRAADLGLDPALNPLTRHDFDKLMLFGLYPRWILLVSATTMMVVCFFISWWIEWKWVQRYCRRQSVPTPEGAVRQTIRNANLLSYSFITVIVLFTLWIFWPS